MKKFLISLLLAFLLVPMATQAQTHYNVFVGSGLQTSPYVPTYTNYNYSFTQFIYHASEIGIDGDIDQIGFEVDDGSATRTLTIYMAELHKSSFSGGADAVAASNFQQVFQGTVSFSSGWVTITLDSAFSYQDTADLVIAFVDGTGSYSSGYPYYKGTSMSGGNRSIYKYNDNNPYSLVTPPTDAYSGSFLPNISLGINSFSTYCATPSNVAVSNITHDQATITWSENGGATSWEVIVSDSAITDFTSASGLTATDTTYTVTGLGSNILYYVYVRALCDASTNSAWTNVANFRSACMGAATVPYSTGFEDLATGEIPNCWQSVAQGSSSASTFPAAYEYSSNARNSNVYFEFESSTAETEIVALPIMDDINTLQLSFYASVMNNNFVFEVGVMEDTVFVPVDTINFILGSNNNWGRSYNLYTVAFDQYTGNGNRIAMRATGIIGQYTLMLDDFIVEEIPSCFPPVNLHLSGVTSNEVTLSWRETGSASSWEVMYDTVTFNPNTYTDAITDQAYDTFYTISNLVPGLVYNVYVRSNCGEYSAWVGPFTFRAGEYVMPYSGSDTLHTCGITVFDDGGANGAYSTYSNFTLVVYPSSEDSVVTFWGNTDFYYNYARLSIYDGVGTTGMVLWQSGSGAQTIPHTVSSEGPITIQFAGGSSQYDYAGFELHTGCQAAPQCAFVNNLTADNVGTGSAHITWNISGANHGMPMQYVVEASEVSTDLVVFNNTVTSTSATVLGLTANTEYKLRVQSECENSQFGDWDSVFVTTGSLPCLAFDTSIHDTTTIGGVGASTTYYLPVNNYFNYSYTQQLISRDELAGSTVISGIDFDYAYSSPSTMKSNCSIFMANTDVNSLSSSFVPFDSIDFVLVYADSMNCTTGWNHFEFTTPFNYNGYGNVLVVVLDNSGHYDGSSFTFNTHSVASGMSRYICNDSYPYDITTVSGGSPLSYRANMRLHVAACTQVAECARPSVVIDSVASDMVVVSWAPGYQETSWNVEYKAQGDTAWTDEGVSSSLNHTFAMLTPNTRYNFRITALCTDTNISTVVSATTLCESDSLPFTSSFEEFTTSTNVAPSCWYMASSMTYGSYPYATTSYSHSGGQSMYLYSSNGYYSYVVLPVLNAAIDSLEVSFWMYRTSSYDEAQVNVGVMTNPEDISTFVNVGSVSITDLNTWTAVHVKLNNYLGAGRHIALVSPSNLSSGPYIDDLSVDYIRPCPRVENVALVDATQNTATLTWDGAENGSYEVEYGATGFAHGTGIIEQSYSDTIVLTGLTPNTEYEFYVRSFCDDGDTSSWSNAFVFRTACLLVDSLPFVEDFESAPAGWGTYSSPNFLPCWTRSIFGTTSNNVYLSSYNAHSGSTCVYWSWSSPWIQTLSLPAIDTTVIPLNTMQLSFWGKSSSATNNPILLIGAMSNPNDPTTFQVIDTVEIVGDSYNLYEVSLGNYHGNGNCVSIRSGSGVTSYWTAYLDVVKLDTIPSCAHVENLTAISSNANSITVGWIETGSADMWEVAIDTLATAIPVADSIVYDTPTITINGLASGSYNYVWVRSICGAGDTSAWWGPVLGVPNSWNMRPNQTDTVYMCGGTIYDDGGPMGVYSASQNNSIVVIMPPDANSIVSVSGSSYTEGIYDYLNIYDGAGTNGDLLWTDNGISATTSFGPFVSTDGPITLEFHSDGLVFYDGFEVNVECLSTHCRVMNVQLDTTVPASPNRLAVAWDNNGAISYEVEYDTAGFTLGNGTTLTVSTNSAIIAGLDQLGYYDVYVRSICGVGDTGAWVKKTFQTALCDGEEIVNAFDQSTSSTTSYYSPLGTSNYNYTYVQSIIDSAYLADLNGDISAFAFLPTSTTSGDYYTNVTVYLANVSETDLLSGFILPDSVHQFVKVLDSANLCYTSDTWQVHAFDTTFAWDGHNNILMAVKRDHGIYNYGAQFSVHSTSGVKGRYMSRDDAPFDITNPDGYDYSIYAAPDIRFYTCNGIACPKPVITGVTTTYESVAVTWNGTGNDYEVNVKEATATDWTTPDIAVTGTNYTFMGLMPSTNYIFRVRQNCTADSMGYSEWTTTAFTTDTLTCATPSNVVVSDVTNATAVVDWTTLGSESAWDVHVWFAGGLDSIYRVTSHPATLSGFSAGITYNVAVRALCGNSLLEGDWSAPTTFTTATCPDVTGASVSNVTASSVTLSWTSDPTALSWIIEYGYAGFIQGQGTIVNSNTNSYVVNGLESETDYDFHIKAVCGSDWNSEHWVNVSATTLYNEVTCNAPTGVSVNAAATTATVSWTAGEGNISFEVEYGVRGFNHGSGTMVEAQNTTVDINGLEPNTEYDLYVRGLCDQNTYSSWSTVTTFTTANVGIDNISGAVCTIYPNPTSSSTTISVSGVNGKVRISVVDMNGRTVATETLECNSDCTKTMDVDHLAQGAYFVRITGDEVNMVRKLVVR